MLGVLNRLVNDPELWRGRAEEARATGEQTTGIEAREILFRIAEHDDWLAPMRGKGTAQETRRPLGAQFLTRADGRAHSCAPRVSQLNRGVSGMLNTRHLLVLGIAGVLGLGATSLSIAAPVIAGGAAIKAAAAGDTINVQWRRWGGGWRGGWGGGWRRGWGWGPGLGVGLGLGLAGAAAAAPYYGGGYYGGGYYGGYGCGPYGACGGYGYAYAPAVAVVPGPVVVGTAYGYGAPYYGGGWRGGWGW